MCIIQRKSTMKSKYDTRRAERIERFQGYADNARKSAEDAFDRARSIADRIPLGQPLLLGHHSEKRHRADLTRIDTAQSKCCSESNRAKYWEERAQAAEKNRAISSRDPNALERLQSKLEKLTAERDRMKAVNRAWRAGKLPGLGFSEEEIARMTARIQEAYSWEKQPFPKWKVSNLSARVRDVQKRIEGLEQRAELSSETIEGNGYRIEFSDDPVRIEVYFDAIPPEETRTAMKRSGFRWSRYLKAWCATDKEWNREFITGLLAE